MNSLKKIIILTVSVITLGSCEPEHPPYMYAVTSIEAGNAKNTDAYLQPSEIHVIDKDFYAIYIECLNELRGGGNPDHFHPYETSYTNLLTINSYNIHALEDFDADHPSGTSLNEYFLTAKEWRYYNSDNTIENYIANGHLGAGRSFQPDTVSSWLTEEYLVLMEPPTELGEYHFVIDIVQSDGILLTDTTRVILTE